MAESLARVRGTLVPSALTPVRLDTGSQVDLTREHVFCLGHQRTGMERHLSAHVSVVHFDKVAFRVHS